MYTLQDDLVRRPWALFHHPQCRQDMVDRLHDSMDHQDTRDYQGSKDHLLTTDTADLQVMEDNKVLPKAHMEDMRVARTDH